MITLKDVAKAAGMSVTQVSRALNNHDDVSEETKVRIRQIANELGYIKNTMAQKLVMQVKNEMAVVVKGFENEENISDYNPIYKILCGVNKLVSEKQYELSVYMIQDSVTSYVEYLRNKGISKAILSGFEYDDKRLLELINSNIRCVFIDIPIDEGNNGCVIINNMLYSTQAVEAMIKTGKKHIAMINGTSHATVSIERESGYKIALAKRAMPNYETYEGDFSRRKAKSETLRALKEHPEIDGFFCASDYMAMGCIEALEDMGKRVPEDIAVVGFDDLPISRYLKPALSTVHQDDFAKGYEAAKLLWEFSESEASSNIVTLGCELIIRDTI